MRTEDLLKDKEAIKLALSFKKIAGEFKTSIPSMVEEGKRIADNIHKNRVETASLLPKLKNLVNEHEKDPEKREQLLNLIDSLNIKGTSKAFLALSMAFFFANNGILTED